MGIAEDDIERVRSQTSLLAVISDHVALRRSGSRWVGLCPFHNERSGSFSVNDELGFYYCFGCQAKGDAITFVREVLHLDFVGAVEHLAGRAGITLHYDDVKEQGERGRRRVLVEAVAAAAEWYHERLLKAPDASSARGYLRSRGYDGEVVRRYKIGWAPDGWDTLCTSLGVAPDVLTETGLAFTNKRDRLQDSFRARIMFPIYDARGDAVAFGGRILPGADGPKYKNSAATKVYDKSEVLYGLNWAKGEIVKDGMAVVCEGYTDVIGLASAGIGKGVATCGTALTERHVVALRRFSPRLVFAYDADAAGQGAAERVYEWEHRHDLVVLVAALPAGSDPGELAKNDPDALRRSITEARPFLAFRLDRLLAASDLATVEGRARAAEVGVELIREHPSTLVRDQYVMELADRCRVDADRLRTALAAPAPSRRAAPEASQRPAPAQGGRASGARVHTPALLALGLAVHDPGSVADLLHEALFTDPVNLGAYRALASAATLHDAVAAAEPEAAELLQRLAVEEVGAAPDDVVSRLVAEVARHALDDLQAQLRASWDDDGAKAANEVLRRLGELGPDGDPGTRRAAMEQLVAFVVERAEEGS
ncbi:MAG: DNA primase [Acidimicrobiales bacterium]